MVIEELHFHCEPDERDRFIEAEGLIWTRFLQTCDGFVRKELWLPEDDPGLVVVMIWWASMALWKAISAEQCAEVDARMGDWVRPVVFARAHLLARATTT